MSRKKGKIFLEPGFSGGGRRRTRLGGLLVGEVRLVTVGEVRLDSLLAFLDPRLNLFNLSKGTARVNS